MRERRGFALVTAIACIVLIMVMATGAIFASNQEARSSGAALMAQKVFAYAERSAILAVADWSCSGCDSLPVGTVIVRTPASARPLESTVYTTKLDSGLFVVVGEGRLVAEGVTQLARRVAITVRITRDSTGESRAVPLRPQAWGAIHQM